MFLDVNGDSINDSSDFWYFIGRTGEPTTVDVYLITNGSPLGGSPACGPALPGLNSYTVNLYCPQSAAVFSNVENKVPGMSETVPLVISRFGLTVGYSGAATLPPGKYHLLRMTVTMDGILGCPDLEFVPSSCYSPEGVVTSFGSDCTGLQGDGILRLGEDWLGTVGLGGCTDFPGRPPSVSCPGAVTGQELTTLTFPVSVFDPDCEIFSFFTNSTPPGATFQGLGPIVAGEAKGTFTWTPGLGQAGTYSVQFTASDPPYGIPLGWKYWSTCSTQVTILPAQQVHPARVFTTQSNQITRIPHGKPYTCFQVEPVSDSPFALEDVVPSSLRIHYANPLCGEHDVATGAMKTPRITDTDQNGIPELEVCFAQDGLVALAPCLDQGEQTLTLELLGSLANGDEIRGEVSHSFVRQGPSLTAISPNPINATSTVEFTTTRKGFARVQIFDVHGGLLTSMDELSVGAGYHRMSLQSAWPSRARFASGVYFVRVATEHDGSETRAVTIVR